MPTQLQMTAHGEIRPSERRSPADDDFSSACSRELSTPPTAPGTPRNASFGTTPSDNKIAPSVAEDVAPKTLPPTPTGIAVATPVTPAVAQEIAAKPADRSGEPGAAPPMFVYVMTCIGFFTMVSWGLVREAWRFLWHDQDLKPAPGYATLASGMSDFFSRRMYRRVRDCWNRPVNTRAGRVIGVMERTADVGNKKFTLTGRTIPCINLASYNYLGFSEDIPSVTADNLSALERYGAGACASSQEGGQSALLRDLELETAQFVGKEAAVVYAMGFVTNFSGLAPLFDKETLVISDSLNHASLVMGVRSSIGQVKVFKHNDMDSLERTVRRAIVDGQPRTHRRWKRVVIIVEGIYSMEGEIVDLPRVVEIKKKYRCLLYVDEAHSIGALGATGRGVCEHHGVDPADVDLLMGTYTKSFGSIGGYIAGDAKLIADLKRYSGASLAGDTLHSAAAQQALSSLLVMQGKDGTTIGRDKIRQLKDNSNFMREELRKRHLIVLGEEASPVIPVMLYQAEKVAQFSRECLKRNVAVVVVGYPATDMFESRARLCISAAHTHADMVRCIEAIDEVADVVGCRFGLPWPHCNTI